MLKEDHNSMENQESKSPDLQKIIKELAQKTKKRFSGSEADLVSKFVENFYVNPSLETLTTLTQEQLVDGLESFWEFAKVRKKGEENVRVFYWKPGPGFVIGERIVIEIAMENLSFILDSLGSLINRLDMKPRLTLHPIFKIERDAKGMITALDEPTHTHDKNTLEAVIHCEIIENISQEKVEELEKAIPEMLQQVRYANEDWLTMRQKATEVIGFLRDDETKSKYDIHIQEVKEFLSWMEDHHFTFLGYANYDLVDQEERLAVLNPDSEPLGILRDKELARLRNLFEGINVDDRTREFLQQKFPLIITKTSKVSCVHRGVPMDCVGVRRFDNNGNMIGIHVFVGLFTSVAYDSSARDIPLLRSKVSEIIKRSGFTLDWHDGKALFHILDSLPRDELFQASLNTLQEIGLSILRLQEHPQLSFFMRRDEFNRFLSCLVYIPRERFDSDLCDRLGHILERELIGTSSAYKAQFGSLAFARVHYTITTKATMLEDYDIKGIENLLIEESKSWSDRLREAITPEYPETEAIRLYKRYKYAFDSAYKEHYRGKEVLPDILEIERSSKDNPFSVRIFDYEGSSCETLNLKIYNHGFSLALSDVLPILENLDLKVIADIPYEVTPQGEDTPIWIHDFTLKPYDSCEIDIASICREFERTLVEIRQGKVENDSFNRLVLRVGLTARECILFRAYAKYIRLIDFPFSAAYIAKCLSSNATITKMLCRLFEARFDFESEYVENDLIHEIEQALDTVENADEDRILRAYFTLFSNTLRTSYFLKDKAGQYLDFVSFKLSSKQIDILPKPRPLYEVFIYAPDVEAVHLRGGRVARGGIRWSDRREDFRREILGLVKAQVVKNTVIVPTGSKGGFIVKRSLEGLSRDEAQQVAIACYKKMMRALLMITDNIVDGKVVHPEGIKILDAEDPYLVVAADKGTATFSDYANEISKSFGFWLGDAFASGGSEGYDHKKMGITAKGAWECVKRHFREIGTNIQEEDFDVIGVGDMSGDVFGNGMLLSKHIRLRAAFNHMHIFIDPNPDAGRSFNERQRLFDLPRSTWADYNKDLISKGGGIFGRHVKSIKLTPEIKEFLEIDQEKVTPDELIQTILKAKADLLWFGGIGTYVKASQESDAQVGDRANDSVRVDAASLRVKVIGEGANLGCTQLGRIEFARKVNGYINTDAIDNSAGVATSDHEVNIKILCNDLIRAGVLKAEDRLELLESMTSEIAEHVLQDNYRQSQILTLLKIMGPRSFDQQMQFIRMLDTEKILDRAIESIPDDGTLEDYASSQTYLCRPELAVVLSYGKIYYYDKIIQTTVPDDPFFKRHLVSYFPKRLQELGKDHIKDHPLAREIIATYAVNSLVNRTGASFVADATRTIGVTPAEVFRAYFTVVTIFDLEHVWEEIEKLDNKSTAQAQIQAHLQVQRILRRTINWLLRYYPISSTIEETIELLGIGIESFLNNIIDCVDHETQSMMVQEIDDLCNAMIPRNLAERLVMLKQAASSPDIILIANDTNFTVPEVATLYFKVGNDLHFSKLRYLIDHGGFGKTQWARKLFSGLQEDLYNYQSDLVISMLNYARNYNIPTDDNFEGLIDKWKVSHNGILNNITHSIKEARLEENLDLTAVSVIVRELRVLSGN